MRSQKPFLAVLVTFCVITCAYAQPTTPVAQSPVSNIPLIENFKNTDRVLILAPHPDDEAIACAGVIQNALDSGAQVRVVYLTNGDHNEFAFIVYEKRLVFRKDAFIHLGNLRKKEAVRAMKVLGLSEDKLLFLGYPDFGTFAVFARYWQRSRPYMSWLTRISSVPYKGDLSYGASYTGESVLSDIKRVLMDYKPNKIFVSHPADTNPDHRADYLFLEIALADTEKFIGRPRVYSYLVHSYGWPVPRHYHPELWLMPPEQFQKSAAEWKKFELSAEQLNKKYMAILCNKTQTESSAFYLFAFARRNELFGDFPAVRLIDRKEPNEGKLLMGVRILDDLMRGTSEGETAEDALVLRGRGKVRYEIKDGCFVVGITKPREAVSRFSAMVYIFGYSKKIPFERMPKICMISQRKDLAVFDANNQIKAEGATLEFGEKEVVFKIPLEILGDPDFVLVSARAQTTMLHHDASAFRKIILK
ncbi:MAG: PIG-L family deacetylase [Candidatus Omnitrophota bacterium]